VWLYSIIDAHAILFEDSWRGDVRQRKIFERFQGIARLLVCEEMALGLTMIARVKDYVGDSSDS
jgi:hypothetical protein